MFGLDIAYRMVAPVVLGLFVGYYLDQLLGTRPWWMLGLTFLGIATGFWTILKQVYYPDLAERSDSSNKLKAVKPAAKKPEQTQAGADEPPPEA